MSAEVRSQYIIFWHFESYTFYSFVSDIFLINWGIYFDNNLCLLCAILHENKWVLFVSLHSLICLCVSLTVFVHKGDPPTHSLHGVVGKLSTQIHPGFIWWFITLKLKAKLRNIQIWPRKSVTYMLNVSCFHQQKVQNMYNTWWFYCFI